MRQINTNEIITIPVQSIPLSEILILSIIDDGEKVILNYNHSSFDTVKSITLWAGEDYTDIGNWTDEDVDDRIIELKDNLM